MENEDYEYLLNRIWYKVQQMVRVKPETAKNFYLLLDKSVKEEISHVSEKTSQNNNGKIKNSTIIKPKGKLFLKYLFLFNLLIHYLFYLTRICELRGTSSPNSYS
jgi:hypothetical protein